MLGIRSDIDNVSKLALLLSHDLLYFCILRLSWDRTQELPNTVNFRMPNIQGDQKVSVHMMITVQKTCKNILNSFNHLP
jgi:hypothetical protein